VTLLFTDVERATVLRTRLGERYAELHGQQQATIVQAVEALGDAVIDTQGETVFARFRSAVDAARAAAEAQRRLASHPWPGRH
jgi:class 3 adenylate cyclase